MNEENPSTDATFDRLLDELHGIQSGQSYAAALEWTSRLRAGLDALESLAVPDRLVGAGGDSLAVGQPMGWTGIMNVLPSGSLQGASGSANMAA